MLSEPPDSYYKLSSGKPQHEQFWQVCTDIENAVKARNISFLENPLWHKPNPKVEKPVVRLPALLEELGSIRSEKSKRPKFPSGVGPIPQMSIAA
jgi:hypothetical protein